MAGASSRTRARMSSGRVSGAVVFTVTMAPEFIQPHPDRRKCPADSETRGRLHEWTTLSPKREEGRMAHIPSRRAFVRNTAAWLAVAHATQWLGDAAAEGVSVIAPTSCGRVRGSTNSGINVFKGIPYGGPTNGKNRFMPPVKPLPWTAVRDA